ncbi:sigma-70 family RNA polymerase sigma factor [Streptomyces sp. NPDC091212]|uniref:RNA polymerase sigma factor n=1 Tax=Streptomyces sp. NPDC091212 TaxID=3155191 RepID=UPI003449F871
MSSSHETPTHTTGAHRALRRAPQSVAQHPPARYEPYLDGLFTYCLSVLCDHDAATEVLGDVLAISERQQGRCPSEAGERRAWLYAIARWACLRKVTEQRRGRQGAHAGNRAPEPEATPAPVPETAARHRRELALLAWPEAAGTTPEQREVLELSVRHRLTPDEVASVVSMEPPAARELLSSAACEVERTRAALAVVDTGDCPSVARLTGDHQVLLSAALRRELVRHVDDCPRCRRAAERVEAAGPWPGSRPSGAAGTAGAGTGGTGTGAGTGTSGTGTAAASASEGAPAGSPDVLPLVTVDRSAAYAAMTRAPRARASAPRFDRSGFPMDPKDRAARRDRLRARAVTTTVVATVVAAPVLALWAAHRGVPQTGEGHSGSSVTAGETEAPDSADGEPYEHYENAGSAQNGKGSRFIEGSRAPDVSVEVISDGVGVPPVGPGRSNPGRITVEAHPTGDTTLITLRASGGEPVSWTAGTEAPWLRLSSHYGTLAPGGSTTVRVTVDHRRAPSGPWSARIALYPAGAVVKIHGYGPRPPASGRPGHTGSPGRPSVPGTPSSPGTTRPTSPPGTSGPGPSRPTDPAPSDPGGPGPSDPGSSTGPSDPSPSDPAPSDPDPDPGSPDPPASGPADPPPSG